MTTPVAWGWGVSAATATGPRPGRFIVVGKDYWLKDGGPGSAGFNGRTVVTDTSFMLDSRRTLQAMVYWLTGKPSGAMVLITGSEASEAAPQGDLGSYGYQFADGLIAYGHTVTWTGATNNFGAYEPTDFDLLCLATTLDSTNYHGQTSTQGKFDYVLANNTSILINGSRNVTGKYGLKDAAATHAGVNEVNHRIHFTTAGPAIGAAYPGWLAQNPFYCDDELGRPSVGGSWGTDMYALSRHTTGGIMTDDVNWTMGGVRVIAECALERYGAHSDLDTDGLGVIGLWRP